MHLLVLTRFVKLIEIAIKTRQKTSYLNENRSKKLQIVIYNTLNNDI